MAEDEHNHIQLTASEISTIWTHYQSETLALNGGRYFISHMEDPDIRKVFEKSMTITEQNLQQLEALFKKEGYPIPQAFTEKDVNPNAPKLFSDKLCLDYLFNATILSLVSYSAALSSAERDDVIAFYSENLKTSQDLHQEVKLLSKQKGIYIRSPQIPKLKQVAFVNKQKFLYGWLTRRPLLGVEITNLVFNTKRNALGQSIITGFSQVAQSKEVRKYFERGRDISQKHMEVFSSILHDEHLSEGALLTTSGVTDSKEPPFSDKAMMTLVTTLIASGIGQYGASMAASPRHDLGVHYTRLMAELGKFANDGAKILIENGWMEQPPIAADRENLAKR